MPQTRQGYMRLDIETARYVLTEMELALEMRGGGGLSELEKVQRNAAIGLLEQKINRAEGE